MPPFTKPAQSIQQQIALLTGRGMSISDPSRAEHALEHISYYRLRAYWLPFEINPQDPNHPIRPGTTFDDVLALYDFDRRLRLLLIDGIELVEVAARGSWAQRMAMRHGPHGYLNAALYPDPSKFAQNLNDLQREINRSRDLFIQHYRTKYTSPPHPPVWMVSEVMSFGALSKWLNALGPAADRKAIARPSGLAERVYMSFLHHLVTVRNTCAHHSRTWNRQFAVTMTLPAHPTDLASSINATAPTQIYNTLTVMAFVLSRIAPASTWSKRVAELIDRHPTSDLTAMGFPSNWKKRSVWRSTQPTLLRSIAGAPHKLWRRLWR